MNAAVITNPTGKAKSPHRFTVHTALGNWMVQMADEHGNDGRMFCLCTRQSDAQFIAEMLNRRNNLKTQA